MTICGFDVFADLLPWLMSAITLWMTHQQGRKKWTAWVWGLINQVLWLCFIIYTGTWGLMPLNIGLWALYIRNLQAWYADEAQYLLRHQQGIAPGEERFHTTTDELKRDG